MKWTVVGALLLVVLSLAGALVVGVDPERMPALLGMGAITLAVVSLHQR